MANDFKRMWTNEELKSNSVLDLPDIPEVVNDNSPDIIRVQGKLYYKKENTKPEVTNLTGTKWYFNETISLYENMEWYINYTTKGREPLNTLYFEENIRMLYSGETEDFAAYYDGEWISQTYRNIEITGGVDVENVELITFLQENAKLLNTIYEYVEIAVDEEVVKAIPTNVSIIEDQGKLELMLEHDGNVLAINDTPNHFLQRRLDKPSAMWVPPQNIVTFLQGLSISEGSIIFFEIDGMVETFGIVTAVNEDGDYFRFVPFGFVEWHGYIVKEISVQYGNNPVMHATLYNDVDETQQIAITNMIQFKLF